MIWALASSFFIRCTSYFIVKYFIFIYSEVTAVAEETAIEIVWHVLLVVLRVGGVRAPVCHIAICPRRQSGSSGSDVLFCFKISPFMPFFFRVPYRTMSPASHWPNAFTSHDRNYAIVTETSSEKRMSRFFFSFCSIGSRLFLLESIAMPMLVIFFLQSSHPWRNDDDVWKRTVSVGIETVNLFQFRTFSHRFRASSGERYKSDMNDGAEQSERIHRK